MPRANRRSAREGLCGGAVNSHEAASDLSREVREQKPKFTDKEKINSGESMQGDRLIWNRERLMAFVHGSEDRAPERDVANARGVD